jgi:hypothetical protein
MALTLQAENIVAIERYIGEQEPARTIAARAVRDDFLRWASGLGAFERNFEQQAYDRARNFRLAFNRANATTPAETAAVEAQAIGGMSTEQAAGAADRRTSDGTYIPPPSGSSQIMTVATIAGVGVLLVLLLRK